MNICFSTKHNSTTLRPRRISRKEQEPTWCVSFKLQYDYSVEEARKAVMALREGSKEPKGLNERKCVETVRAAQTAGHGGASKLRRTSRRSQVGSGRHGTHTHEQPPNASRDGKG